MIKILNKLIIKVSFLLFLTVIGCNKYVESYRGYAFVQVYETEGGNSNINFYLLDRYSKKKSFDQNIANIQKIKTIILTTDNNVNLLRHIQSIRSLKKSNLSNEGIYYLVYVNFFIKKYNYMTNFNTKLKLKNRKIDLEGYHYLIEDSDVEFIKFNVLEPLKGY